MEPAALDFFRELLKAPSPSGYEQPAQDVVRKYVESFADEVATDLHGNVIAVKNPGKKLKTMLAGHADHRPSSRAHAARERVHALGGGGQEAGHGQGVHPLQEP